MLWSTCNCHAANIEERFAREVLCLSSSRSLLKIKHPDAVKCNRASTYVSKPSRTLLKAESMQPVPTRCLLTKTFHTPWPFRAPPFLPRKLRVRSPLGGIGLLMLCSSPREPQSLIFPLRVSDLGRKGPPFGVGAPSKQTETHRKCHTTGRCLVRNGPDSSDCLAPNVSIETFGSGYGQCQGAVSDMTQKAHFHAKSYRKGIVFMHILPVLHALTLLQKTERKDNTWSFKGDFHGNRVDFF